MHSTVEALRPQLAQWARTLDVQLEGDMSELLLQYVDLLLRWNAVFNLTAVRDPERMLTHHLVDCMAVAPALRRCLESIRTMATDVQHRLVDVGSGGGLPGVVLAILDRRLEVVCVDSVAKKVGFIRQAAGELRLANLTAHHGRAQDFKPSRGFDVVTSRAFASLADFVEATRGLRSDAGVWMAMKGAQPDDEIAALPADVEVFHVEPLRVPGFEVRRCIVWMRLKQE